MQIQFFFDPMCPWAYQTSKWIRDVRAQNGLEIEWRFLSLEEINRAEGKRHPWERPWSYGFGQMRVGAWLRRRSMGDLDRWYELVGRSFHEGGVKTHDPAVHAALLAEHGFPAEAVDDALADDSTLDEVRADHEFAATTFGAHGVPTIVFESGYAVYGPVVVPAPTGPAALRLWDLVRGWEEFPHLYELRHPKTVADLAHIAGTFGTYLSARDWKTIERPAL
jgi:predicted DsbA family dithiol-disulfide isomerase